MKAAQFNEYGSASVLSLTELDKPTLKGNQVLIQVKAVAINPFDAKLRSGIFKEMIPLDLPITIGADIAGTVVEVAEGTEGYNIGDEVYGSAIVLNGGSGAAAEFAAANIANIAPKPKNVTFEEAAAAVLVGSSALQALDQLDLSEGSKVLIHGGAGGIGSTAIQYAKHLVAYVATTVQAKDIDFVKDLGADEVIDYQAQRFDEVLKDYDAVFDTVGGETYQNSFAVLKDGGKIISMVEQPDDTKESDKNITALYLSTQVSTDSLFRLTELIESGVIKPQVDKAFELEQIKEAFEHLETGHPQGKVVVIT